MKSVKMLLCSLLLALSGATATAAATQTVTIDGTVVDKVVTALAFDGSNVTVTFADATTQTVEISALTIEFAYSETSTDSDDEETGISNIKMTNVDGQTRVFTTAGQYVGTSTQGLKSGMYIVNGLKVIIK